MKVLLVSRIPAKFALKIKDHELFPDFQIQSFWLHSLAKMGIKTDVFIYSKPLIVPQIVSALCTYTFEKHFPILYAKYQQLLNHGYALNPTNYVRSWLLLRKIHRCKPDIILATGGISSLVAFPFAYARKNKIKTFLLHGEDPIISATSFEKKHHQVFSHIIVNDPTHAANWKKIGAKHVQALPYSGINEHIYFDQKKFRDQRLVFIGTLLPDRQKMLRQIIDFKPQIYGYLPPGIKLDPSLVHLYKGEAWGHDMIAILNRAQVALNFVPGHMPIGGNLRMFEIPGCGALQIVNRCPPEWFKHDHEVVVFNSTKDLRAKLTKLLNDQPLLQKIAKAGYRRTHDNYTYKQRFKYIFSL